MELKRLAPWNWFNKEEEAEHAVPVKHGGKGGYVSERHADPMARIHREIDYLFDQFFHGAFRPARGRTF